MLRALSFATLLLLVGCPKGSSPSSAVDVESDSSGGFIEISMDDEDEDLEAMFGSELMMATAECGDLISLEPAAMMGLVEARSDSHRMILGAIWKEPSNMPTGP